MSDFLTIDTSAGLTQQTIAIITGAFISEDMTCIAVGLLIGEDKINAFVGVFACFLGIFIGDILLWAAGRFFGRSMLSMSFVSRLLTNRKLDNFGELIDKRAAIIIFTSRFMPGTRLPLYLAAGILGKRPFTFLFWFLVASVVWTPVLVLSAAYIGPSITEPLKQWFGFGLPSFIVAVIIIFVFYRFITSMANRERRILLYSSISKVWKWEFWPVWFFYLPVVLWIVRLTAKYGNPLVLTTVNPAILHSGIVGERKSEILKHLPEQWIVPTFSINEEEPSDRCKRLNDEMADRKWSFPLVLKPDTGERGEGFKLITGMDDVKDYFESYSAPVVVQVYHPGPYEAGIFYYRFPDKKKGRIFSITDKGFPEIVGDGKSDIKSLILSHKRYCLKADVFLKRHKDVLDKVLCKGEKMSLAIAGNHCQGTMFLKGDHLITPALEERIDKISREFNGFYFGRFDVRYSDTEEFRSGENFRIVELNGLTSESADIYDPDFGLMNAYKKLFRQWNIAFEIGSLNYKSGVDLSKTKDILKIIVTHYKKRKGIEKISD